jgi:hypothetical protein
MPRNAEPRSDPEEKLPAFAITPVRLMPYIVVAFLCQCRPYNFEMGRVGHGMVGYGMVGLE